MPCQILVVEDDPETADAVRAVLEAERHVVAVAKSVHEARRLVKRARPDLLILDRGLPDADGLELCQELRAGAQTSRLPILFLTGRTGLSDKVLGLRLGGDDYLAKPFKAEELTARVAALLRRAQAPAEGTPLSAGAVSMDIDSRTVHLRGKELELTRKEFDLLRTLLERPGRVLTRTFLLAQVWGYGPESEPNTKVVDMAVMSLRRKLGKWGEHIEAVLGHGYKLRPDDD